MTGDLPSGRAPKRKADTDTVRIASSPSGSTFGRRPYFAERLHMSNAIIKQQGDSPVVADNIWEFRLGAGSFILGAVAGTLVTAAVGRLATKNGAAKPATPSGWPINFAHRGGAQSGPGNTIE